MKLKKHLEKFVHIIITILDEQNKHRMYRKELIEIFNQRVDSRLKVNKHQMPTILRSQDKYKVKNIGRNEYEFENKENGSNGNV